MVHTITVENAGFELALVQWLVLRHELPDQHVLDHRIIASYGLIAPLVTMSRRLSLRRVASRNALPRERFRCYGARRGNGTIVAATNRWSAPCHSQTT